MSGAPNFIDLKVPLGILLTFYGLVLTLYGIFTGPEFYQKSFGVDLNLIWGIAMLVIGIFLLILAFVTRAKKKHGSVKK
jgi:membrane-bound ClpP family serine protease